MIVDWLTLAGLVLLFLLWIYLGLILPGQMMIDAVDWWEIVAGIIWIVLNVTFFFVVVVGIEVVRPW